MICKECNTENPKEAVFCRHCGKRLNEKRNSSLYKVFNFLVWIGAIISSYCLISLVFPQKHYHTFLNTKKLYYADPLGIDLTGPKWYEEEWITALFISLIITVLLFVIRRKCSKQ